MKGLRNYIKELRKCSTKEQERQRVIKEMAHIRQQFKKSSGLSGYDRKKYVAKLIYTYMNGYEIDFGYIEAIELLGSKKYSEKRIGYLAVAIFLNENSEFVKLIINSIDKDLRSDDEKFQCLGLTAIANIGGKEMAESLTSQVQKLLVAVNTNRFVRKKAALCLLRLFRKYPDLMVSSEWAERCATLMNEPDLGVVTSLLSLFLSLVAKDPDGYLPIQEKAINALARVVLDRDVRPDYIYHDVLAPWVQVKLLRLLQYWPSPKSKSVSKKLNNVLNHILSTGKGGRDRNHINSTQAILFEAIDLVIQLGNSRSLMKDSTKKLLEFLSSKDLNVRYLTLNSLTHLMIVSEDTSNVKSHQQQIINALNENDISIKKRALDLLYFICDHSNSREIVGELIKFLQVADHEIKDDLVLKIAILAERFATDFSWYVDVILKVIRLAGDSVSDDIWYRVVRIVTNNKSLRNYAARTLFHTMQSPKCHEKAIMVGAFVLGEFGAVIAKKENSSPQVQFALLKSKFHSSSRKTKSIILTAFLKMRVRHQEIRDKIDSFFKTHVSSIEPEIQQRAVEYSTLSVNFPNLLPVACEPMPPFPEKENALLKRIKEQQEDTMDPRAWSLQQKSTEEQETTSKLETIDKEKDTGEDEKETAKQSKLIDDDEDIPQEVLEARKREAEQMKSNQSGGIMDDIMSIDNNLMNQTGNSGYQKSSQQLDLITDPTNISQTGNTANNQNPQNDIDELRNLDITIGMGPQNSQNNQENLIGDSGMLLTDAEEKMTESRSRLLFLRLCVNPAGVLFENDFLQIGIKSEYHGPVGKMMIFFGNKTDFPFTSFHAHIPPVPFLKFNVGDAPNLVRPKTQEKMLISFECQEEFGDPPTMNISLACEGLQDKGFKSIFDLPIIPNKFLEPVNISAQDFFGKWRQISGPPLESQDVFSAVTVNLTNIASIISGIKLGILPAVDQNPNNIVIAGVFCSKKKQVGILGRVEVSQVKKMIKLTLKTPSSTITSALRKIFLSQLQAN
ncbi:ap-2 complex subunit alpha [Anaeramoeba ignava]|uniref:AP-2 complex subunit alpha n=1 Tax=Anaeramoeba ignava TaxID=1746090 RepID=A0A9Q0R5X1_ANAIG|nr:ap-2 complex subunit alpha [Anaeramoeba ignava]|eukprot:Anaeramoba_ignava/a607904_276.p1 GENE.a607904_276~~a607904_276.p1  ORF type:complete len:1015 (-),score=307.47 a607904_276:74-3118(-)